MTAAPGPREIAAAWQALEGHPAYPRLRAHAEQRAERKADSMDSAQEKNYASGSVISFTPDATWTAQFKAGDEQWEVPVVGWAVIVRHVDGGAMETDIEPIFLDEDLYPVTRLGYLADRPNAGHVQVKITRVAR
jgi:hypothetical protein